MQKKRSFGLLLIFLSFILSLSNLTITGNFIGSAETSISILSFVCLTIGFALFFLGQRETPEKLEVFISRDAIHRAKRDHKIRANLSDYDSEIRKIQDSINLTPNPAGRAEVLGDFFVSPRGHSDVRVAWHYDADGKKLYVDDVLYHEKRKGKSNNYVDGWNQKVIGGQITPLDYASKGYVPYKTPDEIEKVQQKKSRKLRRERVAA